MVGWLCEGDSSRQFDLFQATAKKENMSSLNLSRCINIPDDFEGYSKDVFCIPKHYEDSLSTVLVPEGMILVTIQSLSYHYFPP